MGCHVKSGIAQAGQKALEALKGAGNQLDRFRARRELGKIFGRRLRGHQEFLVSDVRRRGSLCDKCQLEMIDDPVDHGIVCQEGNDLHLSAALRADQRIHLVDFADHLGPACGGDGPELFLNHP